MRKAAFLAIVLMAVSVVLAPPKPTPINIDKCDKVLVPVRKNHVSVRYCLYDNDQSPIYIEQFTAEYGREGCDAKLSTAQKEYDFWNELTQEIIDHKKAEALEALNEARKIKTLLLEENEKILTDPNMTDPNFWNYPFDPNDIKINPVLIPPEPNEISEPNEIMEPIP